MKVAPVFKPQKSKYLVLTADYFMPFLIILGVIIGGYLMRYSPVFSVVTIECTLDYQICENRGVLAELDKLKGSNIFVVSDREIVKTLTSGDFTIREVTMRKSLPGTLKFELHSVYPVVAIQVEGNPNSWLVMDDQFRVIGQRQTDPNVPTVIIDSPLTLTLGKPPTDPSILESLNVTKIFKQESFAYKSLSLRDLETIQLVLPNDKIALFTLNKEILPQLRALQTILADATILSGVGTIDVRFSQPVLKP